MPTEWTIGDGPTGPLPAGTLIGAYRVEARWGEGGMGRYTPSPGPIHVLME